MWTTAKQREYCVTVLWFVNSSYSDTTTGTLVKECQSYFFPGIPVLLGTDIYDLKPKKPVLVTTELRLGNSSSNTSLRDAEREASSSDNLSPQESTKEDEANTVSVGTDEVH